MTNDKFIRDKFNVGAVINTDNSALQAYKLKKNKEKRIDAIEQKLENIEQMFKTIMEKLNK